MESLLARLSVLLLLCAPLAVSAQTDSSYSGYPKGPAPSSAAMAPGYCLTSQNIGKIQLPITNFGKFGYGNEFTYFDCFTGQIVPSGNYPKTSTNVYLFKGGLWIGGIVNGDTLVSTGADMDTWSREFNPEPSPFGDFTKRSILDEFSPGFDQAISEQDFLCVYTDTLTEDNPYPSYDAQTNRAHRPLGIEVDQRSYAWSYGYADDFILFDCRLRNVGQNTIKNMYFGIYMDIDVHRYTNFFNEVDMPGTAKVVSVAKDDETGFLFSYPATYMQHCDYVDTLRLAWTADNDGDVGYSNGPIPVANVVGMRFLRDVVEGQTLSYNWWVPNYNAAYDFGPQKLATYRLMGGGMGSPRGDRDKYHLLSNGEIDYPQPYTSTIQITDKEWVFPNPSALSGITRGGDNHWVLSLGTWDLEPGASVEVPFAYVGGEDWHHIPRNGLYNLTFGYNPDRYMEGLNKADFATNAVWASRIYDNPGVDSDSDGYAGKLRLCVLDSTLVDGHWVPSAVESTYYAGDGIPDWRAASPPPPPKIWLSQILNGVRIRFNGYNSETTRDFLSGLVDFEGYRIYMARDDREGSYSLIDSYDRLNYDVYAYNAARKPMPGFEMTGEPATIEQLRCRFSNADNPCADTLFDPLDYTSANPFRSARFPDTVVYFAAHDYNASVLGVNTGIHKRFPDAPPPIIGQPPTADMLTDDGYYKYYEYEFDITNLLPTVPYFFNVTAFDFGSPKAGLAPMESSRTFGARSAFAASSTDQLDGTLPPVYVYPNPYRVDDHYRSSGFEGRGQYEQIADRVRAIHFANLPPKCTIRIHTLDGDLVREIHHDVDPSDPKSSHDQWDLVSRNIQMIVSGIYYWSVEEPNGQVQIGKLVIIM